MESIVMQQSVPILSLQKAVMRQSFLEEVYRVTQIHPLRMVTVAEIAKTLDVCDEEAEQITEALYQSGMLFRVRRCETFHSVQVLITLKGIATVEIRKKAAQPAAGARQRLQSL